MTLIEVMITVVIIAVMTGVSVGAFSMTSTARLKRSAVMISSAVRVAYGHANATSKPVRLVFDFEQRLVVLEEGQGPFRITRDKEDRSGGAAAATEAEREALAAAEEIVKGPRAPRAEFEPVKAFGWDPDDDKPGKELSPGVRFLQVETEHNDEPEDTHRAYLYFWPGGRTERAAIQLVKTGDDPTDDDVMTLLVSPLTGKSEVKRGRVSMARPRTDDEESDREESF